MYTIVHVSQQGMTGDVYVSFEGKILFNACFSAINNGIYSVSFEGNISLMHVSSYKQGIYRVSFEGTIMFLAINRVYTEFHLKETCF